MLSAIKLVKKNHLQFQLSLFLTFCLTKEGHIPEAESFSNFKSTLGSCLFATPFSHRVADLLK